METKVNMKKIRWSEAELLKKEAEAAAGEGKVGKFKGHGDASLHPGAQNLQPFNNQEAFDMLARELEELIMTGAAGAGLIF